MKTKQIVKKIDAIERELHILRIALASMQQKNTPTSSVWRETAGSISRQRAAAMLTTIKRSRASASIRIKKLNTLREEKS